MALRKKIISVPFAQGLTQKTNDVASKVGTLKDCKNIQINKLGEIKKRKGFIVQAQSGSGSTPYDTVYPESGQRLSSLNRTSLMFDGQRGYATVADNQKYKDVGEILATELEQDNIHEANEAKVGPVAFKRIVTASGSLDVYLWTQTIPFKAGASLSPTYKSFVELKEAGTQIKVSPIIEVASQSRDTTHGSTFNSDLEFLTMAPQTQMLYSSTTDHLYFFYYGGSGSVNLIMRSMDLSGASPSFTLSSATNLITDVCPSIGTFAVDSYNDSQTMYAAYYTAQSVATAKPGDLHLAKITESSGGSLSVATTLDVTNNVYNTTDSQRTDLATKTGCRVNIALRAMNTSANFSVFLGYSTQGSGKGGSNDYRTFVDIYKADLSTSLFSETTVPDGLAFSLNSRHSMLNAASAEIKSGTGASVVYSIALELCSDQGQSLTNALTGSVSRSSSAGTGYVTGLAEIQASTTSPANFGEVPAQVIIAASGGTVAAGDFDIIHAGNQFIAGTNNVTQDGASGCTSTIASGDIETDVDDITIIKPDHGIYLFEIDSDSLPSGVQDVTAFSFKDASLISDIMMHNFGSNGVSAYFAMSKTVGNSSSSSGNTYIASEDGNVVATFLTGNQALNLTSEIRSRIINKFSLMNGVSRVYTLDEKEFLFGSNEFIADEDISADLGQTETLSVTTDQNYAGVLYKFKKQVDRSYPSQEVGLKTYIGGGSLFVFDGTNVVENNFWEFPQIKELKGIDRIVGDAAAQSVSYAFVFSSVDDAGDLHESTTVLSDVISKGGNQSVCGQIYITDMTRRELTDGSSARPQLDIYRTEDNGSVFFKIQSIAFNATDRYITFVDDFKNVIDKERILYTTGGIPDNFTTGSISDLVLYKNRLMAASVSGRNVVLASRPLSQGFSCGFPLIAPFQILIQDETQSITGIEKMPDFFVCFSANNVYAVFGDGPSDAGVGAFTGAKNIGPGQGMVAGSAHLSSSLGAFYISDRGLYLIASNTQIAYLGAQIEDSFIANKGTIGAPVRSIVLNDEENEVRILMQNNSSVLVYNTYFNAWYEWQIQTLNTSNQKIVDHRLVDGNYQLLQDNGTILSASKALEIFTDQYISSGGVTTTDNYDMEVQMHTISANGLQGAQRVYRVQLLGDYKDSHDLTMSVFNDYQETAIETQTTGVSSDSDPYLFRIHLKNQKSRSISVKVLISSNQEGAVLTGLAFEVGLRPGSFKLPAAQTIAEV